MIQDDFSRPPWAITNAEGTPAEDPTALELKGILDAPEPMVSGTAIQRPMAIDLELNGRSFLLKLRGRDQWGDRGPLTGLKRLPCENVTVLITDTF